MKLSRRQFIRNVSMGGGALALGFNLSGCSSDPLSIGSERDFHSDAFLRISEQGKLTLQLPKAEMGQGVLTGMTTLVAEELEVAPEQIEVEMAPVHAAFRDPEMSLQITGGSASIRVYYDILRQVGATARETLVLAAAQDSGLDVTTLQAVNGEVLSADGRYRAGYGQLVPVARSLSPPRDVALKSSDEFRLIGRFDQRLDARAKSDGSVSFGMDVRPDGCVTAVVVRCPHCAGHLLDFDDREARELPGVIDIFAIDRGVAVVAEGYWSARKAAERVRARFSEPAGPLLDSAELQEAMTAALGGDDFKSIREDRIEGDAGGARVEANYHVPFLAHAAMEPQNATVRFQDGRCDVWVGSQSPDIARDAAARVFDIPREAVSVHNQFLGGGFGRRAAADNVAEAAAICARVERPVQLVWSREDDTRHDFYRPAMAGRLSAQVGADGAISDWQHRIVGPSINQQVMPQFGRAMVPRWLPQGVLDLVGDVAAGKDFSSVEGADSLPYTFNGIRVLYHNLEVPLQLGYWRSVGHSHAAFIVESFVDELAHAAAMDPVSFRRRHLPEDSRQRRVLDAVASAAGWGEERPGRFQGVAVHECFQSVVAEIVEISLVDGRPKLERVYCAVDCGQVVNPDIVRDQMEGGIVFGLSAALYGEITLEEGAVQQGNFHDYPVLRHNEMPAIEVILVDSHAHPSGVGEPGTPPAAPALANAVFAATGTRHRKLPIGTA